ncbi:MAG: DNA cytosine methyltransferase [Cyanobacteria bacterium P01_G01_bin.54]
MLIIESPQSLSSGEDTDKNAVDQTQPATPLTPIALSFFSGAMGLDLGLHQAGIKTLLACEVDRACRATIQQNVPDTALIGDIRDYSPQAVMHHAGLNWGDKVDVMVGGPPCQAFSTAGKRRAFEDDRGNVFLTYIETAIAIRPKFIVIENVRGLLSCPLQHRPHAQRGQGLPELNVLEQKGSALRHITQQLKCVGYSVNFNLYNAANFGSPQIRERVVVICARDGEIMPYLEPSHAQHSGWNLPSWRTFQDVVMPLQGIQHQHLDFPEKRLKYYRLLQPGQNWRNLPPDIQKEAMGKSFYSGGGKTGFYRRLAWDQPSPTLVTHPAMPATDLCHPTEDRPLSIQEYRAIQEFPEHWELAGSLLEQYKQVGNAVPVSLGAAIGRLLIKQLRGEPVRQYSNFPYSRYKNTDEVSWQATLPSALCSAIL